MRRRTASRLRLVAVAGGCVLVLAGCAGGSGGTSSSASASATDRATRVQVDVTVKDGKVIPATHRVKVAKGSQVALMVTSDVDDEVHVHGYDIAKPVTAGTPVTIDFTADQTGVFEVETHESNLQLLQLEVE